jgi:DNA-binding transcriptional MerR regulator
MFKVGEFSRIAKVPVTQLHYYDKIDLFKPARSDPQTGYRYYQAAQLAQLNRILALRGLGLSIEQVRSLVHRNISPEELRGMLTLRKAELEQELTEKLQQIRDVEQRLHQIESQNRVEDHAVVIKSIEPLPYLSARQLLPSPDHIPAFFMSIRQATLGLERWGGAIFINHSTTYQGEQTDLEIGYPVSATCRSTLILATGIPLQVRPLPQVDKMATYVNVQLLDEGVVYSILAHWIEARRYRVSGPTREVLLDNNWPESASISEIQIPVEPDEIAYLRIKE